VPLLDRPLILGVALLYLAVVVGIGIWAARRTRTARDFFLAGQGLGLVVTGVATFSASFSGFVFLGGPGLTYRLGIASLWINVPLGFTAAMLCWTLAGRLRRLAALRDVYTVPDAFLARWGSRRVSGLAAIAVLFGSVAYLGVQMQALGVVLDAVFGLRNFLGTEAGLAVGMAIGAAVVIFYATAGGMVAGVYTDLFQGLLMIVAAIAVFVYALDAGGGVGGITAALMASDRFGPDFLDPLGGLPLATTLGFFFTFSVGTLGQPHMLHKFYMLKDPRKLRFMPLILGLGQSLCLLIWVGIGLAVPALVARGEIPPLAKADDAAPIFLLGQVPEALAGLVFAGILAAAMSTADSFVNIGSAALVRDLPRALGWRVRDELRWGRITVLLLAVAAAFFAWFFGDLIALLGTFAFGTFGAALAPALAVGFAWKRITAAAAGASVATGLVLNLGLEFLARQSLWPALPKPPLPPGVLASTLSLAVSFAVLFTVTALTRPRPVDPDLEAVVEG